MKRSLSLTREALTDLTPEALVTVVGAAGPSTPVKECVTRDSFLFCSGGACGTWDSNCSC